MQCLDLTLTDPAANLACDEALLDLVDMGDYPETLRFWESPVPFVVTGYGNRLAEHVNLPRCQELGITVLRRCSGGGTVIQGPGVLSYALILRLPESDSSIEPLNTLPGCPGITETNRFIMNCQAEALSQVLGCKVYVDGITDLAIDKAGQRLKFSGNAQRRKRRSVLFHGTFLLNLNLDLVETVLLHPPIQPPYREGRHHGSFMTNLGVPANRIKTGLKNCWKAKDQEAAVPMNSVNTLIQEKYGNHDWNYKW